MAVSASAHRNFRLIRSRGCWIKQMALWEL